jgi:hypothetical protein
MLNAVVFIVMLRYFMLNDVILSVVPPFFAKEVAFPGLEGGRTKISDEMPLQSKWQSTLTRRAFYLFLPRTKATKLYLSTKIS